jgi:CRISPR system Cascade subunit CasE
LLWRLESKDSLEPVLLVQTFNHPNWQEVFRRSGGDYGELASDSPKEFHPVFSEGQILCFRLKANPNVMRNRKRFGIYREDELYRWLRRQMEKAGTTLMEATILSREKVVARRKGPSGRMTLNAVLFEGRVRLLELEKLVDAVRSGVGHGKALGLGLLSLARG